MNPLIQLGSYSSPCDGLFASREWEKGHLPSRLIAAAFVIFLGFGCTASGSTRNQRLASVRTQPVRLVSGVVLQCSPADAELYVDDHYLGPLDRIKQPVDLKPGRRRIELRKAGFRSVQRELDVQNGIRQSLEITLRRISS